MKHHVQWMTLTALIALGGCGGGGTPEPTPVAEPPSEPTGRVVIGLTDAPGDFLSYQVDVLSIGFTRANGTRIETLPESTRIDFAQYVDVTELVTAATLPAGTYTGVTLQLDYSDAALIVENNSGQNAAAVAVDTAGNALTTLDVAIDFAAADRFVIAPGIPASVTLDFDLEASHKLDLSTATPTATLDGVLLADAEHMRPKTRRARGLLAAVDTNDSSFDLDVRPFFHPRGYFGTLTIGTSETTHFEIDQVTYSGEDGLAALANLAPTAYVVVFGEHLTGERSVLATRVLAGSSVPYGDDDIATGNVVARSGNVLTLRGVTLVRGDMSVTFNDTIRVLVGPDTPVRQQGANLIELTPADLSVGQRLTVIGRLGPDQLDATDGLVRALYTTLAGVTTGVSPMTVDLERLGGRRPDQFDFSGTGASSQTDADPAAYEIDSGRAPLDALDIGAPVRVLGLVAPFGTAPNDFVATTVADLTTSTGRISLRWTPPGSQTALTVMGDNTLTFSLDPAELGIVHVLNQSGLLRDLLALGDTVTLRAQDDGRGVFVLRQNRQQTVYFDFATFSAALSTALDGSTALLSMQAGVQVLGATDYGAQRIVVSLN